MKSCKVSGISGYNIGDKILTICLSRMLADQGINHDSLHLFPYKSSKNNIPIVSPESLKKNKFNKFKSLVRRNIFIYLYLLFKTVSNMRFYVQMAIRYERLYYGGGNLISNDSGSNYLFIAFILSLLFPKGKFNVIFCGIGPFSFPYRFQLNILLQRSNLFIVRDNYSQMFLPKSNNVKVLIDPAIICSKYYPFNILEQRIKKDVVLFNIMDFTNINKKYSNLSELNHIVSNINKIANELGCTPHLYLTSRADLSFNIQIADKYLLMFGHELNIHQPQDVDELKDVLKYGKYALVHRMHAGILATSYCIPTLFFPWQDKVRGFIEMFLENDEDMKEFMMLKTPVFDPDEVFFKLIEMEQKDFGKILKNWQDKLLNVQLH